MVASCWERLRKGDLPHRPTRSVPRHARRLVLRMLERSRWRAVRAGAPLTDDMLASSIYLGAVAPPPDAPGKARPPLVDELGEIDPTAADPVVSAVRSWMEGRLTGVDVSRFASPSMAADGAVLARVLVNASSPNEQLDMSLIVVDRGDGAWEVREMLAAPPATPTKRKPNDKKGEMS